MSFYPWSWLHRNSYDPPLNKGQTSNEWISSSILQLFPCTKLRNILSKVLWGSKIIKSPPTVAYGKVMSEDLGLFEWLSNVVSRCPHNSLVAHIVSLFHRINLDSPSYPVYLQLQKPRKNLPNGLALLERHNVRTFFFGGGLDLNQRSLNLRNTDGRFWEFTSNLSKGDTAYTTLALGAHTDNTYFVRLFDHKKKVEK